MTAPAPAISKVALNIDIDQSGPDELVLSQRMLGMDPYVIVEMRVDDGALVLDAEIGGEEMSMTAVGQALRYLADALEKRGDTLAAQAKATGEAATLTVKGSDL